MTTGAKSDGIQELSASNELRRLAASATSTFAIPLDQEQLFSPLTKITGGLSKPFDEISLTLLSNLAGLLSTVSMPYTMANRSAHDRHWQRIHSAESIRSLNLGAQPGEAEEALKLRRDRDALERARPKMESYIHSAEGRDSLALYALRFLDRLRSDESFMGAANELILQGVVLCWGAFEVFVRECFIAHVNANPRCTLALVGDPVAKRRFELSKVSLETLAEHNFDLSERMGTLLAKQQDLSDVYSVKSVYLALFPDSGKLSDALNDSDLRLLSLRRNLVVHQRGVIDDTYAVSTSSPQNIGARLKLPPYDLEAHLNTTIKVAVSILELLSPAK